MRLSIYKKLNDIKESLLIAYHYFIYEPSKTESILQIYLLNPLYHYIESFLSLWLHFSRVIHQPITYFLNKIFLINKEK